MSLDEIGEFGLIARWQSHLLQRAGVRVGIGDDAAVLEALASPVVTCDCLVEQVHFRLDWTPARVLGRKCIEVNVSDIAAMGGRPVAAFISVALRPDLEVSFLDELYEGFEDAASCYGLTIAGGDTVRSPGALMINVTVVGDAPRPILRSGAREGDIVLVTGTLGDSAAGLWLLQHPAAAISVPVRDYLTDRHHEPRARLAQMQAALAPAATTDAVPINSPPPVTAALDISDGLAGDAAHIAERSGVTLEIDLAALPISPPCVDAAAVARLSPLEWALRGGEDYELLLCVQPEAAAMVAASITSTTGTRVTRIGRCIAREAEPVTLVHPDGKRERAGRAFSHF